MKNISLERNINFDNDEKGRPDYELFSLKITDSLYKKDIEKFLETLSSTLFRKIIFSNLQIQTVLLINNNLSDNK